MIPIDIRNKADGINNTNLKKRSNTDSWPILRQPCSQYTLGMRSTVVLAADA